MHRCCHTYQHVLWSDNQKTGSQANWFRFTDSLAKAKFSKSFEEFIFIWASVAQRPLVSFYSRHKMISIYIVVNIKLMIFESTKYTTHFFGVGCVQCRTVRIRSSVVFGPSVFRFGTQSEVEIFINFLKRKKTSILRSLSSPESSTASLPVTWQWRSSLSSSISRHSCVEDISSCANMVAKDSATNDDTNVFRDMENWWHGEFKNLEKVCSASVHR